MITVAHVETGQDGQYHIQEAIRHLNLAADSADCGVCGDLLREEVETIEGIEDLRARAEGIVAVQAEKRAQLAEDPSEQPLTREYVEVREHEGPEGVHSEVVRGIETEPRPVAHRLPSLFDRGSPNKTTHSSGIAGAPIEFARSWIRDRPRLVDALNLGSR